MATKYKHHMDECLVLINQFQKKCNDIGKCLTCLLRTIEFSYVAVNVFLLQSLSISYLK